MKISKDIKTKIILETDIGNDIDDVLALMMLYTLISRGHCDLIGISINKSNLYSAIFTDIINTFYNRPDIPIGYIKDGICAFDGAFVRQISDRMSEDYYKYPRMIRPNKDYYESVNLLRKLLAESPDNSIVIVSIGLLTNLARLLNTEPDSYSDLSGYELVEKKVKSVCCMGGNFTSSALSSQADSFREFNIVEDLESSRQFAEKWPGEIIFSGYEVGSDILYPAQSILNDFGWDPEHPGVEAYKLFLPMPYDRPCWDLTAVLHSVFPGQYFNLSCRGKVSINDNGTIRFVENDSGKHQYLLLDKNRINEISKIFIELCIQPVENL
jgi:inosine-uridine nucleoside N-ribohydrolase